LSALEESNSTFTSLGYQVIGISPDDHNLIGNFAKDQNLSFHLYSDADAELMHAFGIAWKVEDDNIEKYKKSGSAMLEAFAYKDHHTLPDPAIYIIKDGIIQFSYVNPDYSTRLKTETLIAILSTL